MPFALLDRRQHNDPVPVYLVLMLGQAVCFALFFTVQLIYQVTIIGLNPLQMVMVGVVLEVTTVLFEVPTGVVADVFSRRLSILIGVALVGCAYLLEGGIAAFWAALGGQVFWGVGYTFTSGATQAWITDEIGEAAAGPVFLRGAQMRLLGIFIGTLLSVGLGVVNIQAPMVLAGAGMVALAAALLLVMPERHMRPAPAVARATFGHMKETARDAARLVMTRPVVKVIFTISLIVGLSSEAFDRLHVPSVIDRFAFPTLFEAGGPVLWFGMSGIIGTLLGLVAAEVFKRSNAGALDSGAPARLLATLAAVDVAAVIIFAIGGSLWLAFAMLWVRRIAGTISEPVEMAWLNRNLDSASRATVISLTGQANSIGQVAGGPALGWVGSAVSIQAALLCSALILTPTVALYRRLIVREPASAQALAARPSGS